MNNVLFINACVRPSSRTLALAKSVLSEIWGNVEELDLYKTSIAPLDFAEIEKRNKAVRSQNFTDSYFDLAKQFATADAIVVAAPYWDLMFPAILKTYLENVAVSGITFDYTLEGKPQGMCNAQSLYYITTAGGFIGKNDFGYSYIKALAQNLFEIPKVFRIVAEGLDIAGANVQEILRKTKDDIIKKGDEL